MVQIDIEYEGGLRTRATHVPSGNTLITDAPLDNHGKGESFSPTDLVATALGACIVTVMGIAAEEHGWDLTGTRASVVKKMVNEPVRKIEELEVVISVPHDFDGETREVLERAAGTCPVCRTLGRNVETPVRFEWGAAVA